MSFMEKIKDAAKNLTKEKSIDDLKAQESRLKAEYAIQKQKQKMTALKAKMKPKQGSFMSGGTGNSSGSRGITLGSGNGPGSAFKGSIGSGKPAFGTFGQRKKREWGIGR